MKIILGALLKLLLILALALSVSTCKKRQTDFYPSGNDWSVDKRKLLDVEGVYYVFSISKDFDWPEIDGQPDTAVSYLAYGIFPGRSAPVLLSESAIRKDARVLHYSLPAAERPSFSALVDQLSKLNERPLKERQALAFKNEYGKVLSIYLQVSIELFGPDNERDDTPEPDSIRFYLMPQALVKGKPVMNFSDVQAQENDKTPEKIDGWNVRRDGNDQKFPNKTPTEVFWDKIKEDTTKICRDPRFKQICDSIRSWLRRGKLKMEPEMEGVAGETDVFNGDVTIDGTDYLQASECRISVLLHEFSHVIDNGTHPPEAQRKAQLINKRLNEMDDSLKMVPAPPNKEDIERRQRILTDSLKRLAPDLGRSKLRSECHAYKFIRDHADIFGNPEQTEWSEWAMQEVFESYLVMKKIWDAFKNDLTPEAKREFCECITHMLEWIDHPDRRFLKRVLSDEGTYQKIKQLKEEACRQN